MADEEKAVSEAQESSQSGSSQQEAAVDAAEQSVGALSERITDLTERLTREGRSKAQIKAQSSQLEAQLQTAKATLTELATQNEKWKEWYFTNAAPAEERAAFERTRAAKEQQQAMTSSQRQAVLEVILEEEDPEIRSALREAYSEAKTNGEPFPLSSVSILRKRLAAVSGKRQDAEDQSGMELPRITAARSTGTKAPSLEQQLDAAKKLGKTGANEVLALRSQIAARDAALSRG